MTAGEKVKEKFYYVKKHLQLHQAWVFLWETLWLLNPFMGDLSRVGSSS